ncbi:MAG TPA: sugar ABC transporter ATP-binding protein [Bauldia sp.]|nr:sugar ABC transporter ATP-binding protein [Bauldia sp.]
MATDRENETAAEPVLRITGLTKRFGGTAALQDVDFTVAPAEIHALLGANGAGKSTLIKILAGVYTADSGQIFLGGQLIDAASQKRIAFVHQDLALIETMTVGENMALGYGYARRWKQFIDWRSVDAAAADALELLGTELPLDRPVAQLTRAEKSVVAIARALAGNVDLLVLDEPTASLPEADVARLFEILNRLREHNVSIIYVSHRLDEVFRLADAVTVLRDGRVIANYRADQLSPGQLVTDIVGKSLTSRADGPRSRADGTALEATDLTVGHVGPVSFKVGKGEIVGLAGLRGQGHEDIGRAIAGVIAPDGGSVALGGVEMRGKSTTQCIAAGIGFASSKRAEEAMALLLDVKENLFLNPVNFGRGRLEVRSHARDRADASAIMTRFDVRPADPDRGINTLSGGNQQKVVLARWAGQHYKLLVLEEPTMGVDVGAKDEIYRMLIADAAAGTSCLVISSDLDELVQICDRVLAFGRGHIVAEIDRARLTVETLTHAVTGAGEAVLHEAAEPQGVEAGA